MVPLVTAALSRGQCSLAPMHHVLYCSTALLLYHSTPHHPTHFPSPTAPLPISNARIKRCALAASSPPIFAWKRVIA